MINSVSLKFGSSEGEPPLTIPRAAVTVIVGPNYSGKSKLISEIVARVLIKSGRWINKGRYRLFIICEPV